MYEYMSGLLIDVSPSYAVIDVGGIGYRVSISVSNFNKMPQIREKIFLYTSWVVRENSQTLYGFLTKHERELFEILLSLSGIGPKTALSIIGHLDISHLIQAVTTNNILALTRVPGVGKKTAERLLVDLRGKIDHIIVEHSHADEDPTTKLTRDATTALVNLGYNAAAAGKAVKIALDKISGKKDLSSVITLALQQK